VQAAKTSWPEFSVDGATFARALAARLNNTQSPTVALQQMFAHELYLVAACERGDRIALGLLEEKYLDPIENQLRASASLGPHMDEARQALRVRLLVSDGLRPARISGYRGEGPLIAWLRLSMTRLALNLLNESKRQISLDGDNIAETAGVAADPEIAILVARHRDDLAAAISQAFAELDVDLRTMMRMHFLDAVGVSDIGSLFKVSGRTVQRRIQDARHAVIRRTRNLLFERCGMATRDLETLMRHLQSDLHISLRRVLSGKNGA
jgi:RNA polymerase sigma-70 factor, ECF subfamily